MSRCKLRRRARAARRRAETMKGTLVFSVRCDGSPTGTHEVAITIRRDLQVASLDAPCSDRKAATIERLKGRCCRTAIDDVREALHLAESGNIDDRLVSSVIHNALTMARSKVEERKKARSGITAAGVIRGALDPYHHEHPSTVHQRAAKILDEKLQRAIRHYRNLDDETARERTIARSLGNGLSLSYEKPEEGPPYLVLRDGDAGNVARRLPGGGWKMIRGSVRGERSRWNRRESSLEGSGFLYLSAKLAERPSWTGSPCMCGSKGECDTAGKAARHGSTSKHREAVTDWLFELISWVPQL